MITEQIDIQEIQTIILDSNDIVNAELTEDLYSLNSNVQNNIPLSHLSDIILQNGAKKSNLLFLLS